MVCPSMVPDVETIFLSSWVGNVVEDDPPDGSGDSGSGTVGGGGPPPPQSESARSVLPSPSLSIPSKQAFRPPTCSVTGGGGPPPEQFGSNGSH